MYSKAYKEELKNKIENYSRVNLLSPKQTKKILKLDYDTDFLEDKVSDCLKSPDVKHLQKMLTPKLRKAMFDKKDVSDIGRAVAIGDIIGSQYEFTEHDYEDVDSDSLISEHSFFTDDSVLSYATLAEIRKNPSRPNFRKAYIRAYQKYPDSGYGSTFVRWAEGVELSNREGYGSFANGSAMRVAGVGGYYEKIKDVVKYAIQSAIVTHNHQSGIKGATVTAVVIWMAKNGYSKDDIKKYVSKFYHFKDTDKQYLLHKENCFDIETSLDSIPNLISRTSMFCDYAVPFAVKCFLETQGYKECMAEILRHFCDTDTICAIAGGICYAYYGEINLSEEDLALANKILEKENFQNVLSE